MAVYKIVQSDANQLDLVKHLWEKLNELHEQLSPDFKESFRRMNWNRREHSLVKKSGKIMLDYVIEINSDKIVGYCISTISKLNAKEGEVDSIFVEEEYRKFGIGKQLIDRAVKWLVEEKTEVQKLLVGAGNEQVIEFYKQFDFYPVHIVLQRKH